jgi:hypothetical protein
MEMPENIHPDCISRVLEQRSILSPLGSSEYFGRDPRRNVKARGKLLLAARRYVSWKFQRSVPLRLLGSRKNSQTGLLIVYFGDEQDKIWLEA